MTVTVKWYGNASKNAFLGKINCESDDIKIMLLDTGFVFNQDTDEFLDDILSQNKEVTGTGYNSGGEVHGKILTNFALTYDGATNTLKFTSDNPTWTNSTIQADFAVIYDATPALDADKPLLAHIDFGETKTSQGGPFQITWGTNGILKTVTV